MPAKQKEEPSQSQARSSEPARESTQVARPPARGQTTVQDDVVAKIAARAALETPGVHGLAPYGASERIASLAATLSGGDKDDFGVRVEKGAVECAIDMRIVAEYGVSIPAVIDSVRGRVAQAVQEYAGYQLKELNVEVVDLFFEEEAAPSSAVRQLR